MEARIAVIPGDGIGPEVTAEGVKVLHAVETRFGHRFHLTEAPAGWGAVDLFGQALPQETLELCRSGDAVFFGAVGWPDRDRTVPQEQRPERVVVLTLRQNLYANLRPARTWPALMDRSPVKREVLGKGVDLLIVRELAGGTYYAQPRGREKLPDGTCKGFDTTSYTTAEIERVARVAFEAARKRRGNVCSVDKSNMLASSDLWREVVADLGREYPDVELTHMLADRATMELIQNPGQFDVILADNLFGDLLSDEASVLAGSLGLLPSASLGDGVPMYEPIHGSAPDIAGRGIANPIASILTAAMMLRYTFHLEGEAAAVESAVEAVLDAGFRTPDLAGPGEHSTTTREMGDRIAERIAPSFGANDR